MNSIFFFLNVDNWFEFWWVIFGLGGQLAFSARFIVQWIASERVGRSIIPVAFWYFSIAGGITLLTYAIYRGDPVFIIGRSALGAVFLSSQFYFDPSVLAAR